MTYAKLERFDFILKQLDSEGKIIVANIADALQVAPETIRRDFDELEQQHLLSRVHGGAIKYTNVRNEPVFLRKLQMHKDAKRQIARIAAKRICDGDTIAVDTGTTTVHIADFLLAVEDITVVTNSINLIQKMSSMEGINVISTGGILRKNTMALVGPTAEESLEKIHVDKAFIATNGLDLKYGLSTPSLTEASIKEKMMAIADQVFILADHSKIGMVSFAHFGNLPDIDAVVTGNTLTEAQKAEFGRLHIKLHLVDSQGE